MEFQLDQAMAVLSRTPATLRALLADLPRDWIENNEGLQTWNPFDVVGHLIHGERADWIPRAEIILEHGGACPFEPFDRFAQFEASKGKTLEELLDLFARLREDSLAALRDFNLSAADLEKTGQHPELGRVTLKELLATWVAHDLDHLAQVARTMAKQYADEVGPWRAFLTILKTDGSQ